jgi:diguanylate cyclase
VRPLSVIRPLPRAAVLLLGAALLAGIVLFVAQIALHLGGTAGERLFGVYVSNGLTLVGAVLVLLRGVLVARQRAGWLLMGAGLVFWASAGWWWALVLAGADAPPFPSVADGMWLCMYPCAYAAILLLVRGQADRSYSSMWLDGLIGASTVAAGAGALFLGPILAGNSGSTAAVLTNIAYPVGDLLLLVFVVAVFALLGWRPGRTWGLLAAGLSVLAVADSLYLLRVANETYHVGTLLDTLWPVAFGLLAATAWQRSPARPPVQLTGWRVLLMPLAFALVSAGILLYGNHHAVAPAAEAFAALAIVSALARIALTFREIQSLADSHRQAFTDELTGLGNRRFLISELSLILAEARLTGSRIAVLAIDLDRFKELNDTLGHAAGDRLLAELGPRLRRALPDDAVVARLGGDEFAVILRDDDSLRAPVERAEGVRETISGAFRLEGLTLHVGSSIGVALFPDHGADQDELLQRADGAMYEAKAQRGGARLYEAGSVDRSRERLTLMSELRHAIAGDELVVHYQPQADLRTGAVTGAEALVRWEHPTQGLLAPARFLPFAEQLGLMGALTRVVLERAVEQCAAWRAAGLDIPVAVNLSAASLLDRALPASVAAALESVALPASLLRLEITEGTLMVDPERAVAMIDELRGLGVGFALDDFGTGYSSLAHLKRLPVDELKIDRSFVLRMLEDDDDAIIVRSTIDLARNLGLRTVAEGVESAETWDRLAGFGCQIAQGYFLSRPVPADELTAWMSERLAAGRMLEHVRAERHEPVGAGVLQRRSR